MHLGSLGRSEGLKGRGFAAAHSWTAPLLPACLAGPFPVGAVTHAHVLVPFRPLAEDTREPGCPELMGGCPVGT